jgi:hypothetical protein
MRNLKELGYTEIIPTQGNQERYCFEHINEDRLNINITLQVITKTTGDTAFFSKITFDELNAIQQFIIEKRKI